MEKVYSLKAIINGKYKLRITMLATSITNAVYKFDSMFIDDINVDVISCCVVRLENND